MLLILGTDAHFIIDNIYCNHFEYIRNVEKSFRVDILLTVLVIAGL